MIVSIIQLITKKLILLRQVFNWNIRFVWLKSIKIKGKGKTFENILIYYEVG